jgi:Fe-S-cluster containining protein
MVLLPEIENNERPEICAACGGACCRTRPGIEAPGRFLGTPDPVGALTEALASGDWLLAEHVGVPWVDGVPPPDEDRYRVLRYPRPATVDERAAGGASSEVGASPCVFLELGGCRLPFDARPRMCRSLEPAADGDCVAAWGRREAALAWLPHQEWVAAALARRAP